MEWHQFAMVLSIPHGRERDWEWLLHNTPPPVEVIFEQRSPTVLLFTVEAEMEFLAIEKAESWLHSLAARGTPSFQVGTNPQPASSIDL